MNSISRYMKFVKPYRLQIIGTIIIGVLKFGLPLILPLVLKYVVDDIINNANLAQTEKSSQLYILMGILLAVFVLLRPPIEYYRQYYAQWVGSKILFDIRDQLFSHIQKLSFKYYSNTRTGEVISRVINDVEQTKTFVITGLMNVWLDGATIIIAIIIMFTMSVKLTIVSIILLPFFGYSTYFFFGRLRKLTRIRSQALADLQGYLHERVQGMAVVKSFAIEEHESKQFSKINGHFLNKALEQTKWNAISFSVVNTITDVAPLLVIGFAGYQAIQGELTIGTMVAFIGYIDRLYNPLRRLVNSSTTLTQSIASMDRVFEFIDEPYDIEDQVNSFECKNVNGQIDFQNVSFQYQAEDSTVIDHLNLSIRAGETVAFVGMSGGGKSTLVSLIPRFYDVSSGAILLDQTDIRQFKVRSLRDKIGMVMQDPILFSESVKTNILLGSPNASDEEIINAAKAANAHEFIMKLPQGYDTKVGERGVKLSGGQKQRIAIARVFLKNPPILILDEATSALDLESEQYIQEAIEKLAKNRTTLVVAHRLSTITHADRIVMMENGKVVDIGSHEELMKQKGPYYQLFQIQQLED